jgi:MarR family transcriptional regulator, transcriptional regulator for hemolysin
MSMYEHRSAIMRAAYDPHRSVGVLIKEISRLFARDFETRVRGYGLTQTQWQALAVLARREGIKQAALADLLQVQPISLGRLIDRMEAAGWVERRPAPTDRRAIQLYLTPKVAPLLGRMADAALLTREAALADFDTDEREQLFRMLQRVKANLAGDAALATEPAPPADGHAMHERRSRP